MRETAKTKKRIEARQKQQIIRETGVSEEIANDLINSKGIKLTVASRIVEDYKSFLLDERTVIKTLNAIGKEVEEIYGDKGVAFAVVDVIDKELYEVVKKSNNRKHFSKLASKKLDEIIKHFDRGELKVLGYRE